MTSADTLARGWSSLWPEIRVCPLTDLGVSRLSSGGLPRKEVIQPHLPVQLPCYDFVPVTSPTLGDCLPIARVGASTSGVTSFHDVTGGVYKARERIQRSILTCVY